MSKSKHFNGQADDKMADAYAPPDEAQRGDHIVDVVCRIMEDDGPRPMRNCRPAQKNPNAAEQFHSDHQRAYEDRARGSRDRVQAVNRHNAAYPKMHDELNRKRSTAKVTMMNARRDGAFQQAAYNRCNVCIKNKKRAETKRTNFPSKYTKDNKTRTRLRQGCARVTKPKSRQRTRRSPSRFYRLSKIRTNRGCQCSTYHLARDKKSGTTDIPLNLELQSRKMAADTLKCNDLDLKVHTEKKDQSNTSQLSQYSKESSKRDNPDTDPSVSSYHSYASLEDEPMVSN